MSFGFSFGLPSWKTLSGGFTPASLFTNNEQGVWYEPAPNNGTLFQDAAGTTPVTGVEQFVGLMLDKSKGLVLGSELVTNGTFDTNINGWTIYSSTVASSVSGEAYVQSNTSGGSGIWQDLSGLSASKHYVVTGIFRAGSGTAFFSVRSGVGTFGTVLSSKSNATSSNESFRFVFTGQTGVRVYIGASNIGQSGYFDNISVRELPGNHAFQTSSAKRPKLAARYNLLTYSEEFDVTSGGWAKSNVTVTANAVVAPDGTTTADELVNTAVTNLHDIEQNTITPTVGTLYRITWRVKKSTNRYVALGWWRTIGSAAGAGFDLDTGTVTGTGAIGTDYSATNATIAALGNGWYEIGVTVTGSALLQVAALFHRATAYTGGASTFLGESYAGTTADKTYIWGADLRPASQATGLIGPTYQRVAAATVYDTAGFLPYLAFDGLDDSMSTNSIDFSAGDKMTVWAGYRIAAGTGSQNIAEFTGNAFSTNGGFSVGQGPAAATSGLGFLMNTGAGIAGQTANIPVPYSSVASWQFDSALSGLANEAKLRRNQVAQTYVSTAGTDSGTGNFANAPLYIGSRVGTTVYINGWLTSLIIRGAQSTQSQIEATEAWVNGKTGAY